MRSLRSCCVITPFLVIGAIVDFIIYLVAFHHGGGGGGGGGY